MTFQTFDGVFNLLLSTDAGAQYVAGIRTPEFVFVDVIYVGKHRDRREGGLKTLDRQHGIDEAFGNGWIEGVANGIHDRFASW